MPNIADGLKDVFLAGVGAMALGAEKSKDLIDQLIAKGELTVEQGKQLNEELRHQAADATASFHEEALSAHLAAMSKEAREAFVARVAEMAAVADEKEKAGAQSAPAEVEVEVEAVVVDVQPVDASSEPSQEPAAEGDSASGEESQQG